MHKGQSITYKRKYRRIIILLIMIISSVLITGRCLQKSKNMQTDSDNRVNTDITENTYHESGDPRITQNTSEQNNDTAGPAAEPQTVDSSCPDSNELFSEFYGQAEKLLQSMTLDEKIGQMFLARFPESGVTEEIKKYNPGGYILFSRDFKNETPDSIAAKLRECQNTSKIKLILGVDEEGGTVVRVSTYEAFRRSRFLSPQQLWENGQLPAILEDSKEKSALLKSLGLNMNLVPVADVPTESTSFIYKRSYGRGAEKTSVYVSELIKAMNRDGMISVMKHFPGYGDNVDTHTGTAVDERPYDTFASSDFLPFISGIEAGAPCILVSHNIVKAMDADKPASLSEKVNDILRTDLKFSGIIMTDDLAMDAVKSYVENGESAVGAVLAGNDIIISSDFIGQRQEISEAVKQGKIDEALIDRAVKRILAWKYMYNIIE